MNKKLLAAALGVAFAAPAFADSTNMVIYGRVHQTLVHTSDEAQSPEGGNFTLKSVSSRLGFRGQEDLGGGLKVLFGYEFQTNVDNSEQGQPDGFIADGRHTYVGMSGSFGRVIVGTQDGGNASLSPLYSQASKIGSVSNNGGDLTTVGGTSTGGNDDPTSNNYVDGSNVLYARQRANNSIGYSAEVMPGLQLDARHALNGGNNQDNGATKENGIRETEVTLGYTTGPLYIGGGLWSESSSSENTNTFNNTSRPERQLQLVTTYQLGDLKLGGIINQVSFYGNAANGQDSDVNFGLSGLYKLSGNAGVFGLIADGENNAVNEDRQQFQVSAYYDFSKRTRAYAGFERYNEENKTTGAETDADSIVFGLRHNF